MQLTTQPARTAYRPPRLAYLVELYERNFRLLQRLLPELDAPFDRAVSHSNSDCPLHLQITTRDRYTMTLRLSYEFIDDQGVRRQPDLWLRVYRDAGVVEALECEERPPWLAADEADPAAEAFLTAQWRRNLMLNKWLDYLLEHGHGFGMSERPRLPAEV